MAHLQSNQGDTTETNAGENPKKCHLIAVCMFLSPAGLPPGMLPGMIPGFSRPPAAPMVPQSQPPPPPNPPPAAPAPAPAYFPTPTPIRPMQYPAVPQAFNPAVMATQPSAFSQPRPPPNAPVVSSQGQGRFPQPRPPSKEQELEDLQNTLCVSRGGGVGGGAMKDSHCRLLVCDVQEGCARLAASGDQGAVLQVAGAVLRVHEGQIHACRRPTVRKQTGRQGGREGESREPGRQAQSYMHCVCVLCACVCVCVCVYQLRGHCVGRVRAAVLW